MNKGKKESYSGVATLFEKIELKSFFSNYLYFIIGIELLIFLVNFLGNIGPDKGPFPWKFYFYVSFVTPVAITFLLGVFILAFNHFIFGTVTLETKEELEENKVSEDKSKLFKINLFLAHMKEVPFLPILFTMIAATVLLYKLDAIFLFLFSAGEKVVTYILIGSGILLSVILIFAVCWVFINYRLSKKQMEHEYKYRNDVMDKLGILIMHDNTLVTKDGKVIHNKSPKINTKATESLLKSEDEFKMLPPIL